MFFLWLFLLLLFLFLSLFRLTPLLSHRFPFLSHNLNHFGLTTIVTRHLLFLQPYNPKRFLLQFFQKAATKKLQQKIKLLLYKRIIQFKVSSGSLGPAFTVPKQICSLFHLLGNFRRQLPWMPLQPHLHLPTKNRLVLNDFHPQKQGRGFSKPMISPKTLLQLHGSKQLLCRPLLIVEDPKQRVSIYETQQ